MTRTPSDATSEYLEASVSRTNISGLSDSDSDELAQAIHHIKALRRENEALKTNMRRLKQVHSAALEEVKRLQSSYNRVQDERALVDREYQRLCESWRVELEDKQRSLEQAQHQIVSAHDVELIKARITEEVEGAFQARYEGLTRDHADMQTTLTALRRELQAARTELDTTARRGRTEADGARLQAERAAGDLRDEQARCRELHEARDALRRKLNAVEGEKSLLAAEVLELKAELQEVRGRAQSATVERETIAIDCERTIAKMKSEVEDVVLHAESLERRRLALDDQVRSLQRSQAQLTEDYRTAELAKQRLQAALDDATRRAQAERESLEALWGDRVTSLEGRLTDLRQQMGAREEAELARDQEHLGKMEALQRQHEQSARDTTARWQARIGEVERDRAAAEARAAALEQAAAEAARTHKDELRELQHRLEGLRSECADLKTRSLEAQGAAVRAREDLARKEGELEEQRRDYVRAQTDAEASTQRFADVRMRCDALATENRALTQRVGQLEGELQEEKSKGGLSSAQLAAQLDGQRRSWAMEKSALVKRAQQQLRGAEERYETKLMAYKQRMHALKMTAQKYAEERAQLMITVRELEAKGGAPVRSGGRSRTAGDDDFPSALEEVLNAIAPQLESIKSKQREYFTTTTIGVTAQ